MSDKDTDAVEQAGTNTNTNDEKNQKQKLQKQLSHFSIHSVYSQSTHNNPHP